MRLGRHRGRRLGSGADSPRKHPSRAIGGRAYRWIGRFREFSPLPRITWLMTLRLGFSRAVDQKADTTADRGKNRDMVSSPSQQVGRNEPSDVYSEIILPPWGRASSDNGCWLLLWKKSRCETENWCWWRIVDRWKPGRLESPVLNRLRMSYTFAKTQNCPQVRPVNWKQNECIDRILHRIF